MRKNKSNQWKYPKDASGNEMQPGEFYSNTVQVRATNFEVEIRHLLVDSDGMVKSGMNVRMSPEAAAGLAAILHGQINGTPEQAA
ncbi:MAG: hypothetical protein CMN76_02160 [Spirochaetaceae bacterium]|nr:hypothetical protein [Spirochaetaceae bacterium]|tara:strand:- start:197 stop:451 length:255 start_codon:yes stop_codon:yes gene_type:complete